MMNILAACRGLVSIILIAAAGLCAAQAPKQKTQAPTTTQAAIPEPKTGEAPGVLVELNHALEMLAAKVSPALVQVLVTGYGPLREEQKSETAFIVRQHAVGSG